MLRGRVDEVYEEDQNGPTPIGLPHTFFFHRQLPFLTEIHNQRTIAEADSQGDRLRALDSRLHHHMHIP